MARPCVASFGEEGGSAPPAKAGWTLGEDSLTITPEGASPRVYALREIRAISGDGFLVEIELPGGIVTLSRLGGDGPGLIAELRRLWLPARAEALRVGGAGEPARFTGRCDAGESAAPCEILLHEEVLLIAREGKDLAPFFLALAEDVSFDETSYAVLAKDFEGRVLTFDKLAGKTGEFRAALERARANLAGEAAAALAAHAPLLDAGRRAALAGAWPPGRFRPMAGLEGMAPGFGEALRKSWLPGLPRRREAERILSAVPPGEAYLCFRRPGTLHQAPAEPDETSAGATGRPAIPTAGEDDVLLWLLARTGEGWLLEAVSEPDHATYCFEGAEEVPRLLSRLLCAPRFSVEAVYLPLDALAGERGALSLPAREVPFLRELRTRFRGRVLHLNFEKWVLSAGLGA